MRKSKQNQPSLKEGADSRPGQPGAEGLKRGEVQFNQEAITTVDMSGFATFSRYNELHGLPYAILNIRSHLDRSSRWLALIVQPDKIDIKIGESKSRKGAVDLCKGHLLKERENHAPS